MTIDKPGIYTDISSAAYFADPCVAPSLTQSIAKVLIDQSPLHAWHAHPRLNPDYQPDDDTRFDVGNVAHKLMIGRGKEIAVLDGFDDWRKAAAKEAREAAAKDGKIAVLGKTYQRASNMVSAARGQLGMRGLDHLFDPECGNGEVMTAWQEDNIWLRQLIDWLDGEARLICDYKTTKMSVAAYGLDRMMATAGWPIQAAMAGRGLDALAHEPDGRRRYLFVVQEDEPPYALNVVELTEGPMTMGRKMLQHAVDIWSECMRNDLWPGYRAEIIRPEYPAWSEAQWLQREIDEAARERMPTNLVMAG